MDNAEDTLIMVYNADGGLLNAIKDSFHKTFAPETYPCPLCALAFGFFTMERDWRQFLARVPLPKIELHRDDYGECLPNVEQKLPVIVLRSGRGRLQIIASASEMQAMDDLNQLIELAERRLEEAGISLGIA